MMISSPLPTEKARFLTEELDSVQGFLVPSTALYLAGIENAQRGTVEGDICEIGVHRGKSFLAMTVDLPPGDAAVAIDIFDAQHLNMEGHSVNALRDFKQSLEAWRLTDRIEIVEGSSLDLEDQGFLKGGRRFRLFSVDGGHLDYHVLNDLRLAEETLVEGGVVAADDLLHPHYLGVITGVFQYFHSGGQLVPFALIPNKLLLTDAASVDRNKAMMRDLFGAGIQKKDVPFHTSTIDVYDDAPWVVEDAAGKQAPLLRPEAAAAASRSDVAALQRKVDRLKARNRALRQELRAATEARPGRADVLPAPLRQPARALYRRVTRRRP